MKIIYEFTEREKEFLLIILKNGREMTGESKFDKLKKDFAEEWKAFRENNIFYHSNPYSEGAYIRYSLTEIGKKIAENLERKKFCEGYGIPTW